MKYARLFRENELPILVSAEEVKMGLYNRKDEFVDVEYEYKVQFVKSARNNGGPYFRMYYSYEEYKQLYPERASRYDIIANMRRYKESPWHKKWKKSFSDFCVIEKCIHNEEHTEWKFSDAYYDKTKTCIEFQHSYISFDFEKRNEFYSNLSINTIWLYDLTSSNVRFDKQGNIEILEDNARGFFRISENTDNLKKHYVYIQVKSGRIYRVNELFRCVSSTDRKSTIRYFIPTEIYTEEEFINAVRLSKIGTVSGYYNRKWTETPEEKEAERWNMKKPQPLHKLWNSDYAWMKVEDIEKNEQIIINRDENDEMYRDRRTNNCIQYKYADGFQSRRSLKEKKEYSLSHQKEKRAIWILVEAKLKKKE